MIPFKVQSRAPPLATPPSPWPVTLRPIIPAMELELAFNFYPPIGQAMNSTLNSIKKGALICMNIILGHVAFLQHK